MGTLFNEIVFFHGFFLDRIACWDIIVTRLWGVVHLLAVAVTFLDSV